MPSQQLQAYIKTYPKVENIMEQGNDYILIWTTMNNNEVTAFKNDVFNRVVEVV